MKFEELWNKCFKIAFIKAENSQIDLPITLEVYLTKEDFDQNNIRIFAGFSLDEVIEESLKKIND